jgi:predicted Zn finger-like uncharacterized protein
MVMTVECPSCAASFPVDPAKIPEAGVNARCSSCGHALRIERPAPIDDLAPDPVSDLAAAFHRSLDVLEDRRRAAVQRHNREPAGRAPPDESSADEPEAATDTDATEPDGEGEEPSLGEVDSAAAEDDQGMTEAPFAEGDREEISSAEPDVEAGAETDEQEVSFGEPDVEAIAVEEEITFAEPDAAEEVPFPAVGSEEAEISFAEPETEAETVEMSFAPPETEAEESSVAEPAAAEEVSLAEPEGEEATMAFAQPELERPAAEEPAEEAPTAPASGFTFGKRDPKDKAKQLARVLVSDMVMYNPDRHEKALASGTLKDDFEDEIDKSWKEYIEQVGPEMAEGDGQEFWREALNDVLAKGESLF